MNYLIKVDGVVEIKIIDNATDGSYHELKRNGNDVIGVFGRMVYAEHWRDFYNGLMTREELKTILDEYK